MRKLVRIASAALIALTLVACGAEEPASGNAGEVTPDSSSAQEPAAQQGDDEGYATLVGRPVEAASNMLIVQNPEDQQFGLFDADGNEVLPCEYGDMRFITVDSYEPKVYVAAQSKGSYGVYDLDGNEIVAPTYDDIVEGAEYADCIIVQKSDAVGVVDLNGDEVIPTQYDDIACSPQGMLGARAGYTIDLFSSDGALQNSIDAETVEGASGELGKPVVSFYNYGNIVCITAEDSAMNLTERYLLDGTVFSGLVSLMITDGPYFDVVDGSTLSFVNGETGETVVSADLQLQEGESPVLQGDFNVDAASGDVVGVVEFTPMKSDLSSRGTEYYLVSLGSSPSIAPIDAYDEVGPFYDGSAFAVRDGKLYSLDASGEAAELPAPFNAQSDPYLLYEGCAVLNNNDYIYVVDKDGNDILSEDGYASVDWTYGRGEGLIVLASSDGSSQVIDTYGNEIIPPDGSYRQVVLYDAKGEDAELYSFIDDTTNGKFTFIDNENLRALETRGEMGDDFADQLMAGQGWVLWDDVEQKLVGVVSSEEGYQICDVAGVAQ